MSWVASSLFWWFREQSKAKAVALYCRLGSVQITCDASSRSNAYRRQFWNDDADSGHQIDAKVPEIVVRVVSAHEEQPNGHCEQPLLRRCVLVTVVDLLPHVEVVVRAGVEVKGNAAHPVEHYIRSDHVSDVGEGP